MGGTRYTRPVTAALLGMMTSVSVAHGQTITVTISSDVIDVPASATVDDLPGPDGEISFSEAMIASNNTPGHQTIGFAIPQSDWQLQFAYPGRAVLRAAGGGFYFRANDEVTIDGTTQTAFTGDTNPDGAEVAIYGAELYLNADNCELVGFDSSPVNLNGSNGTIRENTGTMNISVFGGSGGLIQENSAGTIKIDRSNDNVVVGNTMQRVRVLGWVGGGQPATNNRVGGPNLEDRNYITGYGTWSGEGAPGGTTVQIFDSINTLVENNWIGTTTDGMAQGNLASTIGIGFEGVNEGAVIRNNRIAGILGHGIGPHYAGQLFGWAVYFWGTNSGIEITGNTIGLNAKDEPVLGSVWGVAVDHYSTYSVSGTNLTGNVIAGHLLDGIRITPTGTIRISANSIYANGWLGIDLVGSDLVTGVTPNDPFDADSGGNGLQNFPMVDSATREDGALHVTGTLASAPSSSYTLEFFASPDCDSSGYGEGELFVGTTGVTTNGSGNAAFDVILPATADAGWMLSATATLDPIGATSEFSACTIIAESPTASLPGASPEAAEAAGLRLAPSHPNPFRTETTIRYRLPSAGKVELAVYDTRGRRVRTLMSGEQAAGTHTISWDGRAEDGAEAAAGHYFFRIRMDGSSVTGQTVLIR